MPVTLRVNYSLFVLKTSQEKRIIAHNHARAHELENRGRRVRICPQTRIVFLSFAARAPHAPSSSHFRLLAHPRHSPLFTLDRSLLPVVGTDSGRRRHVRLLRRDVLPSENSDDDDRRRRCRQKRAKISGREDSESDRTLRADCFGYASSHGKSSSQRSDRLVALLRKDTDEEDEYQQQQQQQQSSKRDILEKQHF